MKTCLYTNHIVLFDNPANHICADGGRTDGNSLKARQVIFIHCRVVDKMDEDRRSSRQIGHFEALDGLAHARDQIFIHNDSSVALCDGHVKHAIYAGKVVQRDNCNEDLVLRIAERSSKLVTFHC